MSAGEIAERIELPAIEARRERKRQAGERSPRRRTQPVRDPLQQQANALVVELAQSRRCCARSTASGSSRKSSPISGSTISTSTRGRTASGSCSPIYERDDDPAARARQVSRSARGDRARSGDARLPRQLDERRSERAARGSTGRGTRTSRPRGINENYARELMELHTLGVDGGYTQKDVTEVARAFTGWTIENPRRGSGFRFEPRMHDAGREDRARTQRSRRAAASRTANASSTSSHRTRRRRASSRSSSRAGSSATNLRRRWSIAPRPGSAPPTATCAR